MKHTKGKWKHDDGHIFIDDKNRQYTSIAHVYDIYDNEGNPETNAQLIAAAPDLLDALVRIVQRLEEEDHSLAITGSIRKAKDAIEKATK